MAEPMSTVTMGQVEQDMIGIISSSSRMEITTRQLQLAF